MDSVVSHVVLGRQTVLSPTVGICHSTQCLLVVLKVVVVLLSKLYLYSVCSGHQQWLHSAGCLPAVHIFRWPLCCTSCLARWNAQVVEAVTVLDGCKRQILLTV